MDAEVLLMSSFLDLVHTLEQVQISQLQKEFTEVIAAYCLIVAGGGFRSFRR
jgi:hypothetical protein